MLARLVKNKYKKNIRNVTIKYKKVNLFILSNEGGGVFFF